MHNATPIRDRPTTGDPIALQVHKSNSQPVVVPLQMAIAMVAFGVSVVAFGFALVFGSGCPLPVQLQSLGVVSDATLSTSIVQNANADAVMANVSVDAFDAGRPEPRTDATIGAKSTSPSIAVRRATIRRARPLLAPVAPAIESPGTNRIRRSAFYEDIPSENAPRSR